MDTKLLALTFIGFFWVLPLVALCVYSKGVRYATAAAIVFMLFVGGTAWAMMVLKS
jgi:hypothetical protein